MLCEAPLVQSCQWERGNAVSRARLLVCAARASLRRCCCSVSAPSPLLWHFAATATAAATAAAHRRRHRLPLQDSIELLKQSGIDFAQNEARGIDVRHFGELLTVSGVVLNEDVSGEEWTGWRGATAAAAAVEDVWGGAAVHSKMCGAGLVLLLCEKACAWQAGWLQRRVRGGQSVWRGVCIGTGWQARARGMVPFLKVEVQWVSHAFASCLAHPPAHPPALPPARPPTHQLRRCGGSPSTAATILATCSSCSPAPRCPPTRASSSSYSRWGAPSTHELFRLLRAGALW